MPITSFESEKIVSDLVTFGEAMVRLAPPGHRRLEQTTLLDVTIGGAELNVAAGITRLGLSADWVSCLPADPLGRMARNRAREFGVGIAHLVWGPGRMGLYFVEYGTSPRRTTVLYDRSASAFSEIESARFDWTEILKVTRAFHTTGITTALNDRTAECVARALRTARSSGVLTVYDLNYRSKLWSAEKARAVQGPLLELVDVLITTEEDAGLVLGVTGTDYGSVAHRLADTFGFKVVAITVRGDQSVLRNTWTSVAYSDGVLADDREYDIELVDRVGGGDAFAAGFIYGLLTGDFERGVRYGNAFAALKQTSWGDLSYATLDEVEAELTGASVRILR